MFKKQEPLLQVVTIRLNQGRVACPIKCLPKDLSLSVAPNVTPQKTPTPATLSALSAAHAAGEFQMSNMLCSAVVGALEVHPQPPYYLLIGRLLNFDNH